MVEWVKGGIAGRGYPTSRLHIDGVLLFTRDSVQSKPDQVP